MKEKIARRSLLKTLGTAAAAGTAACGPKTRFQPPASVPPGSLPRVNLICHGMMLFWQDITKIQVGDTRSGITIYIPDVAGMHTVSLTTLIGGTGLAENLLHGPGSYVLGFTCKNSMPIGKRDANSNLVIYDTSPHSQGLAPNAMNAQYVLQVPYPTTIRPYRFMRFKNGPPYNTGAGNDTTTKFGIHPAQLAGLNVLTYDSVTSPVTLAMGGGTPEMIATPPPVFNLHLYASTKPGIVASPSHLQYFNGLLSYNGKSTLDLVESNAMVDPDHLDQIPVDSDLSQLDMYDLVELQPGGRASDPVGCIEGWGS